MYTKSYLYLTSVTSVESRARGNANPDLTSMGTSTTIIKEPGHFFFHFFQSYSDFGTIRIVIFSGHHSDHALIPLRLEENCKNSPILLIWW